MLSLADMQTQFQNYLLNQHPAIQPAIVNTDKIPIITRLNIYRDAYYLRLLEALTQDYAGLLFLLGEEQFTQLGRQYIDACPSQYRSIRWFTKDLAAFMTTTQPYQGQPFLIEMATFEWLLIEAFDAPDAALLTLEHMTTLPATAWPELCFTLHPALRRLELTWNTVALWNYTQQQNITEPAVPQQAATAAPWIIWRHDEVKFVSLAADEAYMIDAMAAGDNFSTICAGLCEWVAEEHVSMHAAQLLKRFMLDGLISSCHL